MITGKAFSCQLFLVPPLLVSFQIALRGEHLFTLITGMALNDAEVHYLPVLDEAALECRREGAFLAHQRLP